MGDADAKREDERETVAGETAAVLDPDAARVPETLADTRQRESRRSDTTTHHTGQSKGYMARTQTAVVHC